MKDCIFCKIIGKELPAEIVFENDELMAFKDINPKAPVHLLIVPKKHISSVNTIGQDDLSVIGQLFLKAKEIAGVAGVREKGYKLVVNVGEGGGQEVFHLHVHLLGEL